MSPCLDIYGLTTTRDRPIIQAFLDEYVDQVASDDRGDEDLMLMPLIPRDAGGLDAYDWEPARSLAHIIERGLDYPRRAFNAYLRSRREDVDQVILGFTADDMLVLGLSIEDEGAKPENEQRATNLLDELMTSFHCHMGTILVESPPPRSEEGFRGTNGLPLTVLFKSTQ